jgi:uncharacterized membrane protein
MRVKPVIAHALRSLQRNILAGIITIGPLFVTYLIFSFLLSALAKAGLPVIKLFAVIFPEEWLSQPWLQSIMAIVLTLAMLYVVGRVTSAWWSAARPSNSSRPHWIGCPWSPRSIRRCVN